MDALFESFNIHKLKSKNDFNQVISDIFIADEKNLLSVYKEIRQNSKLDMNLIYKKTELYMDDIIKKNTNIGIILDKILNIMSRLLKLFSYVKNRIINDDIYHILIDIFYKKFLDNPENLAIVIDNIFSPLIIQKRDSELIFNKFIKLLRNLYDNSNFELADKLSDKLIEILKDTLIQKHFISNKTLNYIDLIQDYKLIKRLLKYEQMISRDQENALLYSKLNSILINLPIIRILCKVDIYECDQIYYDIISDELKYIERLNTIEYIEQNIKNIESNIIISKDKYNNELLLIELSKIFKIYNMMYTCWGNDSVKNLINKAINNILNQDNMFLHYIATALIIFVKKITSSNINIIKEMVIPIVKNIALTDLSSEFLNILYLNMQNNLLKNIINDIHIEYCMTITNPFASSENKLFAINKFLNEIIINKKYNKEIKTINIKCNKKVSVDMNKCDIILINKEIWKNKQEKYYIKIPDEINIYYKSYEAFYDAKHNYRLIEWSLDDSFIDFEFNDLQGNPHLVSGSIIPMSVLFLIDNNPGISLNQLLLQLILPDKKDDIKSLNKIKSSIELLVINDIIQEKNNLYTCNEIKHNINLSKLIIAKNKLQIQEQHYDINSTIDCYIIKCLKVAENGFNTKDLLNSVNLKNQYFKINEKTLIDHVVILIKKNYITESYGIFSYLL